MPTGKKKGRAPAHQNTFAFQHNPKSKKTERILNAPNVHVCRRCFDKIEWRKKYRKYKPRSQPGKCNICDKRNVMAAYHTICTCCTTSDKAFKSMTEAQQSGEHPVQQSTTTSSQQNEDVSEIVDSAAEMSLATLESPPVASSSKNDVCHRVCAMCVKEPALPDEDEAPETVDEILARENRRVKLRERRALERKLVREKEQAKQAAKEARRREREAQAEKNDSDDDSAESDLEEEEAMSDNEDPFLQAVGGEEKLLTGEAYQKMLLEREQQGLAS